MIVPDVRDAFSLSAIQGASVAMTSGIRPYPRQTRELVGRGAQRRFQSGVSAKPRSWRLANVVSAESLIAAPDVT